MEQTMTIKKEPEYDPRNMVGHEKDEIVVYHLKRIQVLLLLMTVALMYMAAGVRAPTFL